MPTSKRAATKRADEPAASRPQMPKQYGIPKDKKGLLPWSYVSERMAEAKYYWVSTVDGEGRPHSTPVDGLWIDERLYFGGSPETKRHRNLAANPAVCIHLENALEVVILHGEAIELRDIDASLVERLIAASKEKYGYAMPPEAYTGGGLFMVRPHKVLAWKQFPKDVTRWQFPNEQK